MMEYCRVLLSYCVVYSWYQSISPAIVESRYVFSYSLMCFRLVDSGLVVRLFRFWAADVALVHTAFAYWCGSYWITQFLSPVISGWSDYDENSVNWYTKQWERCNDPAEHLRPRRVLVLPVRGRCVVHHTSHPQCQQQRRRGYQPAHSEIQRRSATCHLLNVSG